MALPRRFLLSKHPDVSQQVLNMLFNLQLLSLTSTKLQVKPFMSSAANSDDG
jgi:hypothetical protein